MYKRTVISAKVSICVIAKGLIWFDISDFVDWDKDFSFNSYNIFIAQNKMLQLQLNRENFSSWLAVSIMEMNIRIADDYKKQSIYSSTDFLLAVD